jgi:Lar family restriction alleviation protein
MTDQTKLEPCPFCGKEATRIRPNVHTGLLQIQCDSCWATSVTSTNRAVVIAAWNRRAGKDASGEAARVMLSALQTTRLQLHAALAGKNALSNDKHLSIVEAAIAQAEAAGITTGEGEREPTYYANKCECGHALGDHADELACTVAGCPCIHFTDAAIAQAEAAGITED